jgi:4-alpha-glucanotransferase
MSFPRSSGILLHPTSFPSRFGIGDFGPEAYQFIDFLAESGQQLWQVLPLSPTGYGNSPYMSYSAFAGNPMLICPETMQQKGLLSEEDLAQIPEFPKGSVDFEKVIPVKMKWLETAYQTFQTNTTDEQYQQLEKFCDRTAYWIEDYALFMALKEKHHSAAWTSWEPPAVRKHQPEALETVRQELSSRISFYKFLQFEFNQQWQALKQYANDKNVQIVGDIPIYVAHDSADVWANSDLFYLDEETGETSLMAGVPPDYFAPETGQLWGNPVYNWEKLKETEFEWWVERFRTTFDAVNLLRIDHFRGFEAFWAVPKGETTAKNGQWLKGPGIEFFEGIGNKLGKLPIIAEDLGLITPEVDALRDHFDFPGMKILQFAFESPPEQHFLPHNYKNQNCVVYPGTHDNDTTVGWYQQLPAEAKEKLWRYLDKPQSAESEIHWELIRLGWSTIANQSIAQLQDVLGLGNEARMNAPGKPEGNWSWRYQPEDLSLELRSRLKRLTETYQRLSE